MLILLLLLLLCGAKTGLQDIHRWIHETSFLKWSVVARHCRYIVMKSADHVHTNKANLRCLIAATGLVILPKLDSNRWFFRRCDLEIWWMTFNKANLRDLIAATGLVILLKFDPNHRFFSLCDLEIWCMTSKFIGHLFYTTSSFVYHFKSIGEFKLKLQSENAQLGSKSAIFCPVWPWNLMDDLGKQ